MCGLAGFVTITGNVSQEALLATVTQMNDRLSHRGPDDFGSWCDQSAGVALGHRRLSILDLSPEGHQPMHSADQRFTIVFNGEIYNYLSIRSELLDLGHTFRGHSDTEVMLAAFRQWGVADSVARFNGMFSFAAWDRAERTLWLSRDRFGKKPMYYGWCGNTFLFGSELKALRAHADFDSRLDRAALLFYLRLGYIIAPFSVYERISKLMPGTVLALNERDLRARHTPAPRPYWSAADAVASSKQNMFRGTLQEAADELHELLRDSVSSRMISDVPVGAFLSGGIDSSLVVSMMRESGAGRVRTFSIGFHDSGYNEATYAKQVADHLGTDHTEMYVTPAEAMAVVPLLPSMFDEPFADSSQIPTYLVCHLARQHVTVSLSGDGGDELFGGYSNYFSTERFHRRYSKIPAGARGLFAVGAAAAGRLMSGSEVGRRLRRLSSSLNFQNETSIQLMVNSYWPEPETLIRGVQEHRTVFTDGSLTRTDLSFFERMMLLDAVSYLPDDILVKVDRTSMAVSLEARCPLLDYRVFEFAWRLPMSMKVNGTEGKSILRNILYQHVPKAMIERPKQGFAVPVGDWIRGPLRDWAESLLTRSALEQTGLLNPGPVRNAWQEHLSGVTDNSAQLWIILMLQAWVAEACADVTAAA